MGSARTRKRPNVKSDELRRWRVTPRDELILTWITRHGVVTHEQIGARFFVRDKTKIASTATYGRMRKLEELRFIDRHPPLWYLGPRLISVTKIGAELADVGLGPAVVALNTTTMRHSLAVVDLSEDLLHEYPDSAIKTEREMRRDDRLRRREGATRRNRDTRFPDALLTLSDGRHIAIELDLSHKTADRHREKVQSFLRYPDLHVWWYCGTKAVLREIRHAVETERADDRIEVCRWRH
jgi:hypothetical protein